MISMENLKTGTVTDGRDGRLPRARARERFHLPHNMRASSTSRRGRRRRLRLRRRPNRYGYFESDHYYNIIRFTYIGGYTINF